MSEVNRLLAGRYLLERLIGQGGMADVYQATDQILKRVCAVKILRSSLTGDPIYITRFHREASAAAALSHPNIVSIYDVGDEDELYYIVMEYVHGQTLKQLIYKRGALHYAEAVDIMKQVTSGTAAAHAAGIIHRDLKPQNILVTDSGTVKIADFGIASIQSLSQVTGTDTIMGSLHYLAPEVARGEKASPASDIYALGIVFYELLRGEVPFNGESPVNIALKHMRDDMPSLRAFNANIPQSVENIVLKATAKNPKERYQSAAEMLEDINTCLNPERMNEEKLSFAPPADTGEKTIIANTQFFTRPGEEEEPEEEDEDITETRTSRVTRLDNRPRKKKKSLWKVLVPLAVIAIVALAVGLSSLLNTSSDTNEMPNVIGMKQAEAISLLEDDNITVSDDIKTELSDDYEEGYVISSDPEAGETLDGSSVVTLTVSSGKYIVMANYVGEEYASAKSTLEKLGFTVKKYEKTDEEYAEGIVIDQSISEGEKQNPNDDLTVTLTVSKGILITVPSLYGESISTAKTTCEDLGFKVKTEVLDEPTDATEIANMTINTVVKQSLTPYTTVTKKGKTITLYYYDHIPSTTTDDDNGDDDNGGDNTDDNTDSTDTNDDNNSSDDSNTDTTDTSGT